MKAAYIATKGPAAVLQVTDSYPKPVRQPGEVLVRIHAASVNPVDIKTRTGLAPSIAMKLPQVCPSPPLPLPTHPPADPHTVFQMPALPSVIVAVDAGGDVMQPQR